jgi:hypothetical protein
MSGIPGAARSGRDLWLLESLVVIAAALAVTTYLFRGILHGYQPWFDNLPLIVWSTPVGGPVDWTAWFTRGMSGYFYHHPGWPNPPSGFVRPGVNALFWVDYQMFGHWWEGYLLANYVLNALAVMLVFRVARGMLALPLWAALGSALVFAVSPATTLSLLHPSYAADVLVGVWVVAGLLLMRGGRAVLATGLFVMGVLTKETGLVGPVAALLSVLAESLGSRRVSPDLRRLVLYAGPILIWVALRVAIPHASAGVYPIETLRKLYGSGGPAILLVHTLTFWPLGVSSERISDALGAFGTPLFVTLNVILFAGLGYRVLRAFGERGQWRGELEVSVWAAAWIPFFFVAPPEARHAYGFYMVAIPLLASLVVRGRAVLPRIAVAGLVVGVCAIGGLAWWRLSRPVEATANFQRRYAVSRGLVAALQGADARGCAVDYLAPNVVEYGEPEALRRFAAVRARIVNLTTVDGQFDAPWTLAGVGTSVEKLAGATRVSTRIPPEFHYLFVVPALDAQQRVTRAPDLSYWLPDALDANRPGKTVVVDIPSSHEQGCVVAFDFGTARYVLTRITDPRVVRSGQ